MKKPSYRMEKAAGGVVAGVDEAGRGPLAGPVVAAAVVLDASCVRRLRGLDDSKRLDADRRARFFDLVRECGRIGVGEASVAEIDELNILNATMLAMTRAVEALGGALDHAFIDGDRAPPALPCRAEPVIGGDGTCLSIAAASVIAKVSRDRYMIELAETFPDYGWRTNVGYGTPEHLAALRRLGPTPHHRHSFAPVAQLSLLTR